jgi:hypothetical protein
LRLGVVIAISALTLARAEEAPYLILSVGSSSCGTFIKSDAPMKELYLAWAIGFVSGANTRSLGHQRLVGDNWERNASLVLLENYCTKDPLSTFHMAVEALRNAFATKQGVSGLK